MSKRRDTLESLWLAYWRERTAGGARLADEVSARDAYIAGAGAALALAAERESIPAVWREFRAATARGGDLAELGPEIGLRRVCDAPPGGCVAS